MYIKSLKIKNLRCFRTAKINFSYPDADNPRPLSNINLLLGHNGAGKSTVLKAVVLALLGPSLRYSGFVPNYLVRREKKPKICILSSERLPFNEVLESVDVFIELVSGIEELYANRITRTHAESNSVRRIGREPAPSAIIAYGATRRMESGEFDPGSRQKARRPDYDRVAGIFEDHIALTPLSYWLPRSKRRKECTNLLNQLLPEETQLLDKEENGEMLFQRYNTRLPHLALSDGYRAYIAWVADMLYHLDQLVPPKKKLQDAEAIVLVDEIDLHMHPDWQRRVVKTLSEALPKIQFIFTSHSPILAGTVPSENIRYAELNDDGTASIREFDEEIQGKNADQILTSAYFGLTSARSPEAVRILRDLSHKASQGDADAALKMAEFVAGNSALENGKRPTRSTSRTETAKKKSKTARKTATKKKKKTVRKAR